MAVEEIAAGHAERQVALARRTAIELGKLWRHVDRSNIAASWGRLLPQVLAVLGTSQATAAASAGLYVDDVLAASGVAVESAGRIQPGRFAGIASDGRPLASLMLQPAITALEQIKAGASPARALSTGRFTLDLITRTQVADAGRTAVGAAIAARPEVTGYVRMIVGKTCSRCLILAGKRYRWNQGFRRHPRCDCRHVPYVESVPEDVTVNPDAYVAALSAGEQDQLLGKAGAEAVRAGSDLAQVVNARRGMATAGTSETLTKADGAVVNVHHRTQTTTTVAGRQVFTTTAGAGRRPRLMPEQIYRDARNRDDAIRLLRLHGYIL